MSHEQINLSQFHEILMGFSGFQFHQLFQNHYNGSKKKRFELRGPLALTYPQSELKVLALHTFQNDATNVWLWEFTLLLFSKSTRTTLL